MAYMNVTTATAPAWGSRLRSTLSGLATRYKNYRLYRETYEGLNALTDRDLADLGLHRSELQAVARDSAARA